LKGLEVNSTVLKMSLIYLNLII